MTKSECSVKNDLGNTFNFLSLSQENFKVSNGNGSSFLLNICKPVLYGHDAMCPPGSSVCFIDGKETDLMKKFKNYGSTDGEFSYENDKFVMKLKSDEKCNDKENMSSVINIVCEQIRETEVEFIARRGCENIFYVRTNVACRDTDPCKAVDPVTGKIFNLASLSDQVYSVSHGNDTYQFGVCKTAMEPCLETSGICQTRGGKTGNTTMSLGMDSDYLQFNKTGSPYLIYENGAKCGVDKKWQTKIEFVCAIEDHSKKDKSVITVVENTNCQIIIQFETWLVCQKQVSFVLVLVLIYF